MLILAEHEHQRPDAWVADPAPPGRPPLLRLNCQNFQDYAAARAKALANGKTDAWVQQYMCQQAVSLC